MHTNILKLIYILKDLLRASAKYVVIAGKFDKGFYLLIFRQ